MLRVSTLKLLSVTGAESGTPRDSESGPRDRLVCTTCDAIEETQGQGGLERFGQPERKTLHPLLMCCCVYALASNELQILYKVNASALLYLKGRSYMWCITIVMVDYLLCAEWLTNLA
jgi:hypothetical protein